MRQLARLVRDDCGVAAIEYCLLAALIALGIVTSVGQTGSKVSGGFGDLEDALSDAPAAVSNPDKGKGKDKPKKNPKG